MPNVILRSLDGEDFSVDLEIARMSRTVRTILDDLGSGDRGTEIVPLANVRGDILKLVIKWAEHHFNDPPVPDGDDAYAQPPTELSQWDQDFFRVDKPTLFDIIMASNYLDMGKLLDSGCKTVANMIKGKTPEEIRRTFTIRRTRPNEGNVIPGTEANGGN